MNAPLLIKRPNPAADYFRMSSAKALRLNHDEVVRARRLWVSVGWWPPES